MKSASTIQLDKAWWKKEQPAGLKKSGPLFEKALDAYGKSLDAAKKGDTDALESALKGLEKAAKEVISEAKALEKATKDKKEKDDLSNTVAVMARPLDAAITAERKRMAELSKSAEQEEDETGILGDPRAYLAYFRKSATTLARTQMNFAIGLPGQDPKALRILFHRSLPGKGMTGRLKKEIGARKVTFGVAGTSEMAEAYGETAGARTLVLDVQGPPIPSLAKRVRVMMKTLKIPNFSKVLIIMGGKPVEASDENDSDAVDTVDLDDAGENGGETQDLTALASRLRELAAAGKTAVAQNPALRDKVVKAIEAAKTSLDTGDGARCQALLNALEQVIASAAPMRSAAAQEAANTIRKGAVEFGKALLAWQATRKKAQAEMRKLEAAISATLLPLKDEMPEIENVINEARAMVGRLDVFDERLDDMLKDIMSSQGEELARLKVECRGLLGQYRSALADEFFKDVDSNNGFQNVEVTSTLDKSLSVIERMLT